MPPKKPVSKAKKPAGKIAKTGVNTAGQKPVAGVAAKRRTSVKPVVKKPGATAVAKKRVKAIIQKASNRQKTATAGAELPVFAESAPVSAGWVASPKQTFENKDILKLTFGYLWRVWLLAFTWGMLVNTLALAVEVYKLPYQSESWVIVASVVDMLVSLVLSISAIGWLQAQPRLLGGIKLASSLTKGVRWWQVLVLWFSFAWRSILLILVGMAGLFIMRALTNFTYETFPFISMVLKYGSAGAGIAFFLVGVPYLVWRQLLKKQTFSWGKLELLRVKS